MNKYIKKYLCIAMTGMTILGLTGCANKPGVASIENNKSSKYAIPDYSAYCTLGEYKDLTYTLETDYNYSDEEKEARIQMAINQDFSAILEETEVTDRAAQKGDTVNIVYKGTIDGESFDGGDSSDSGSTFTLGYGGYVDGFEDAIIGMKTGESKDVTVTLDSTDTGSTYKDKEAVFNITLNHIYEYSLPELTDDLVAQYTDYETYDEYYKALKDELDESIEYAKNSEISDQILDEIVANSTFKDAPEDELQELVDEAVDVAESRAEAYSMDVDEYVSEYYSVDSLDDYKTYMLEKAKEYMQLKMAICEIARTEGITITEDDVNDYKTYLKDYYSLDSVDDVDTYVAEDEIIFECIVSKVQDVLVENSKQVDSKDTTESKTSDETEDTQSDTTSESE